MEHVALRMQSGELGNIRPAIVIANRDCGAIEKAQKLDIPTEVIKKSEFQEKNGHKKSPGFYMRKK